jgi:uncharacterized repeat protein (TIGR01451 family)
MKPHSWQRSAALALATLTLQAAAHAQGAYVFTKILDNETVRPDGQGSFYLGFPQVIPAIDGNSVIFQDLTGNATSLWSASASGGGFVKLADFNTPVPAGVGNFTRLDDQTFRARDGVVLFEGLDSNTSASTHGGLYSIPETGGAISKVIDYNTQAPDANGPFIQSNANNEITAGFFEGDYDFEGGVIAFHGLTANNGDGTYSVHLDGTALTRLADKTTLGTAPPFPVSVYYNAALHNGTSVFYGSTVFNGYGILSSPVTGGLSSPTLLATPSTPLPGGQAPEMTTVYYTGLGKFDHTTGNFIFAAHDGSGINGLYSLPANGLGGGVVSKIVDNQTALPGSAVPASYFDGSPFSADNGQVAFVTATNQSANQVGALYVANADGSITRVIGVGDTLDGISLTGITLGAHALSGGQIAFGAGSYLQGHDGLARYGAIFVATPTSMTADLALTVTAPSAPAAIGQQVTFTITVTNNGPAAAPTASIVDTLPAGLEYVSDNAGGSVTPSGVVTLNTPPLAAGATGAYQIVAQVTAAGSLVNSAAVTGSVPDANLANNTAQTTVSAIALPTVAAVAKTSAVHFGGGEAGVFKLTISPAPANPIKVSCKFAGTAINGADYVFLARKVKVKAGKGKVSINVIPLGDGNGASRLTVKLTLLPGDGYVLGDSASAKIKILAP